MKNNGYIKTVLESLIGINTCTSAGSETIAADYLKEEFARMGVKAIVYEPVIGKGSVVAEIPGRQMASIVLHSHLDTADALDGEWDVPPFRATRIGEKLYGRGAIDSKGLTAVWMGVIKGLLEDGRIPDKTIVFAATAGEEIGGEAGTQWLLGNTTHFRNAELVIGEGGGIPIDAGTLYFTVQTGERENRAVDDGARGLSEAEITRILEHGIKAGYYDANTIAYVRGDIETEKRHIPREYFYETLISKRNGQTVIRR
jgi:acetylornithine deacetylase/succinyl-diaminopimelate desuccinylase-like protein